MRPLTAGAAGPLLRAVAAITCTDSASNEPMLTIQEIATRDWASATFVGATHQLDLCLEGSAAAVSAAVEQLRARLDEAEIAVPGHIVADIALTLGQGHEQRGKVTQPLIITALVVED
jgi:hypothetical protein